MAFNLFGSPQKEEKKDTPKQNLFVLPVKNKAEQIKEKAVNDAAFIELGKKEDKAEGEVK